MYEEFDWVGDRALASERRRKIFNDRVAIAQKRVANITANVGEKFDKTKQAVQSSTLGSHAATSFQKLSDQLTPQLQRTWGVLAAINIGFWLNK